MCGIFGILDIKTDVSELRTKALEYQNYLAIAAQTGQAFGIIIIPFCVMNVWLLLM